MSSHTENIKCPNCESIQEAEVEHAETKYDWDVYIHNCTKCDYTIMESEWEEVKPIKPS